MAGPNLLAVVLVHADVLQGGLQETAHASLGADVKEDAEHGQEKNRLLQQAEAGADAGRLVGLRFPRPSTNATNTKARPSSRRRRGKRPASPCSGKRAMAVTARHQVGGGRAADALDALGESSDCGCSCPSALTSRMMGLPATCRKVVPTPSRKMQPSSTGKLGGYNDGISTRRPH